MEAIKEKIKRTKGLEGKKDKEKEVTRTGRVFRKIN